MHLKRIKQTLSCDDELLRLFFHWQRSNERCDFLGCLPLRKLSKTLLTSPDTSVNDLEEELTSTRVKDEDRSIDWLRCQIALECLVNRDSIDVGVVNEELGKYQYIH